MAQAVRTSEGLPRSSQAVPYSLAVAADDAPQTFTCRGIRPDDPLGRVGLRNPERGWRIETVVAQPPGGPRSGVPRRTSGTMLPAAYSDLWWTDRTAATASSCSLPIELAR